MSDLKQPRYITIEIYPGKSFFTARIRINRFHPLFWIDAARIVIASWLMPSWYARDEDHGEGDA